MLKTIVMINIFVETVDAFYILWTYSLNYSKNSIYLKSKSNIIIFLISQLSTDFFPKKNLLNMTFKFKYIK